MRPRLIHRPILIGTAAIVLALATLPAPGQMVVYDTSWYRRVLIDRITKTVSKSQWQGAYDDIRDFVSQLAADGTVIGPSGGCVKRIGLPNGSRSAQSVP